MEQKNSIPLKLNMKRTFIIGFAFFGILLLWQVYDVWCPTLLQEAFMEMTGATKSEDVQYLVGVMMALDNLAALILMPIFGKLSDKTHTKLGKRMPYILVGTFVCAIAFPFVPLFFHFNNYVGMIVMMAIVLIFAMMYRNPAVALMPDLTPKPLRSKANGIINIMGYIGGAFATLVGMVFVLTDYLGDGKETWAKGNVWAIVGPFLVASVLMVISAVVLIFTIRENELAVELADELAEGEKQAAVADSVEDDDEKPMSKANFIMLILILAAEFFWFMSDNGVATFMLNYSRAFLGAKSSGNMIMTLIGGVGSVIGFAAGGFIADKIGRKWTISSGLMLAILGYISWIIFQFAIGKGAFDEKTGYYSFPLYLYLVWGIKGFGMSLVHLNSFPMVVELCSKKKVGQFTGYYYMASMAAQTITPILLGLLLRNENIEWSVLPIYALICSSISFVVFLFVKNIKAHKVANAKGLEGLGAGDD
ncbi:MAG: MFS transporter [Bacilli bacterium]|nr:MFS transporter [Bacilli bacterium]